MGAMLPRRKQAEASTTPTVISIDRRAGSMELLPLFPKSAAILDDLPFGDFAFTGHGPDGREFLIGIERKAVRDLMNSIRSGRLSGHQLVGMADLYNRIYLIVEGQWRPNPLDGSMEDQWRKEYVKSGEQRFTGGWRTLRTGTIGYMYAEAGNYLTTLEEAGVRVKRTGDERETVKVVMDLAQWWAKDYEKHRGHLAMHATHTWNGGGETGRLELLGRPPLAMRMAAELEGIGIERAREVAKMFRFQATPRQSAREMTEATEEELWRRVKGVGKVLAGKVIRELEES